MQGILFNHDYGMFQAVVAGTKTETRRLQIEGRKPRFKVGEVVYLKEPYVNLVIAYPEDIKGQEKVFYKYDAICRTEYNIKWKNKMFMPERYARHFIEITEVVSETLNTITEESAIAEGVLPILMSKIQIKRDGQLYLDYSKKENLLCSGLSAISSYMSLWEKINGKDSWIKNPKVWVYKFKLVK